MTEEVKEEKENEKKGVAKEWYRVSTKISQEERQVFFCAAAYAFQKAISLLLMTILPLAVVSTKGSHMLSILIIGMYQLGISLTSLVSGKVFSALGRRRGYIVSVLFFFVGASLGTVGIYFKNVVTLIVSMVGVGMAIGISGTVRFAAMEVSKQDRRSRDNAVTLTIAGGIFSGAFGPLTAPAFAGIFPEHPYLGCYVLVFVFTLGFTWLIAVMIKFPSSVAPAEPKVTGSLAVTPSSTTITSSERQRNMLKFILATASSTWSNTFLMLIMSSVLTEMVVDRDFSLVTTSISVSLCFLGRFILGPFSGSVLQDYGLWLGQLISCICFLVGIIVFLAADASLSLAGFVVAMTLVGFGWHFGFATGNLLLRRIKGEQRQGQGQGQGQGLQTQALHDFTVFFTSGLIVVLTSLANPSWNTVLSIATAVTILLMITSSISYCLGITVSENEAAEEECEVRTGTEATKTGVVVVNPMTTLSFAQETGVASITTGDSLSILEEGSGTERTL